MLKTKNPKGFQNVFILAVIIPGNVVEKCLSEMDT